MDCIKVEYQSGFYAPIGAATVEDWSEVRGSAVEVIDLGLLTGWGWERAYLLTFDAECGQYQACYFVGRQTPAVILGAKGGAARTERKAAAVAENGKKGGRPPGFRRCKPGGLRPELAQQYMDSSVFSHKIIECRQSSEYQALIVDSTVYLMHSAGHNRVLVLRLVPGDSAKARGAWFDGSLQILSLRSGKLL